MFNLKKIIMYEYLIILFVGMLVGTIMVNMLYKYNILDKSLVNNEFLALFETVDINKKILFTYIFNQRIKSLSIIILISLTRIYRYLFYIFIFMVGTGNGIAASVIVIRYKVVGILIYFMSMFPQYIFYGIAMYIILKKYSKYGGSLRKKLTRLGIVCLLTLIGIISETFLCPILLKLISQFY